MNPFDVIATDLDGTFLTDEKKVPALNAQAVREAAERGIHTIYASGRPVRWFHVLDDLADTHGFAVAANGAVTLDLASGEVLHARLLAPDVTSEVAGEIRWLLPHAWFAVEYLSQWGAEPASSGLAEVPHLNAPLDELLGREPMIKLLVVDPTTPTDELAAAVGEVVSGRLTVTFSHVSAAGMLELSAPGVSKALALRELLTDLRSDPSRMIAFGDMPNDIAMLELAGLPFTMSRAHQSLLAACYPVADDNNDAGVGRTILRLLSERADGRAS